MAIIKLYQNLIIQIYYKIRFAALLITQINYPLLISITHCYIHHGIQTLVKNIQKK